MEKPSKDSNTRLGQEGGELEGLSLHIDNLFDQNEDVHGQKVDEATGKEIRNDESPDMELTEVEAEDIKPLPEGQDFEDEDDEAAKWLKGHGNNKK